MKRLLLILLVLVPLITSEQNTKSTFELIFSNMQQSSLRTTLYSLPFGQKIELSSFIMKNVGDPFYELGKKYCMSQISIKSDIREEYYGLADEHYISDNLDGQIIRIDDGSIWQVEESDIYISSIWVEMDDVKIKYNRESYDEYCYFIKNQDERVSVKLLSQ